MNIRHPLHQAIASALAGLLFLNPIVATAAQLAVDAAAGGNTSLGAAGNGVPLVNIATPNGAGLSHNKFSDYSVGQQGLILNNATGKTASTQLGGIVLGNPNLKGQAAQKILNEVTSGSPAQLRGYTEVAGQGAHVIVAAPGGVTCSGCGFINTPRVTLTTGKPILAGERLQGYDVDGGAISIEGAGLNAGNVDQFELITRSAKLNADLYAKQLTVVAGRNTVDAQTLAASAKPDDGSAKPQLAIDSSALGGMYANSIRLVGTEAGIGVKLAGNMAASAGDIRIDANGKLELAQVSASADLALKGRDVALNGPAYAGGNAFVQARGGLSNAQSLAAGSSVQLSAASLGNSGVIEAGVNADNSRNAQGDLFITAQALRNAGSLIASRNLSANAATFDNRNGQIGGQFIRISGGSLDNRQGLFAAEQSLQLDLASLDNREQGLLSSRGRLTGRVGSLNNQQGGITAQAVALQGDSLDNRGGRVYADTGLALDLGTRLDNSAGGTLGSAGGLLQLRAGDFDNRAGIAQGATLRLDANSVANSGGHLAATSGDARVNSAGFDNSTGSLFASQALVVTASDFLNHGGQVGARDIDFSLRGTLDNTLGLLEAADQLTLAATSLNNNQGRLRALGPQGTTRITTSGLLDNRNGSLESAAQNLLIGSGALLNDNGSVRHLGSGQFGLDLAQLGQAGGSFITQAAVSFTADSWSNRSSLQARELTLDIGQFQQGAEGQLLASEKLTGRGGDWTNAGRLTSDGSLDLNLGGRYSATGELSSLGVLNLRAASLALDSAGSIAGGADTTIATLGSLDNSGRLTSDGDLSVRAASLNNHGTLGSGANLRVETPSLLNENGLIFSGADMTLRVSSFTNRFADVFSLGALDLAADDAGSRAARLDNLSATLESQGDMRLNVAALNNARAVLVVNDAGKYTAQIVEVNCYKYLNDSIADCSGKRNGVWEITERDKLEVLQASAASSISAGGDLRLDADQLNNASSQIAAGGDLYATVQRLTNQGVVTGEIETFRVFVSQRTEHMGSWRDEADAFSDQFWYESPNYRDDPAGLAAGLSHFLARTERELGQYRQTTQLNQDSQTYAAIIQAAGNVEINASELIDNSVIRQHYTYVNPGDKTLDTGVGSGVSTPLPLNPQLPPDLAQQAVDPLSLPGFQLPQGNNGLFHVSPPGQAYLIETNPALTGMKSFLGSDYLLGLLGYDPAQSQKRLGDGLYEQRLIQQAVVARTGQRFIDGMASDEALFKYLMDNAIAYKDSLNLAVGVALTAEQVAALTHDIVWLQDQVVNGEHVLVPVLYLAQAKNRLAPNGALIQGQDVSLISGGALNNQGTLRASNDLNATALNIGNSGLLEANRRLQLLATDSIRNAQGGVIKGRDLSLTALSGDVSNERSVTRIDSAKGNRSWTASFADSAAHIEADNDLSINAGRDINNTGGVLKAGNDLSLSADRDINLNAAQTTNGQVNGSRHRDQQIEQLGGEVSAGHDLYLDASRDLTATASQLNAGHDAALSAGRDVTLAAAANESHSYSKSRKVTSKHDSVEHVGTQLSTGGDLSISAGQDLTLVGSQAKAQGSVALDAERDVAILSAQNEEAYFYKKKKEGSFGKSKTRQSESYASENVASVVQAGKDLSINVSQDADGAISLNGGRDVNIVGSQLMAGKDLLLGATGDVNVLSGQEAHGASSSQSKSGFGGLSKSGKSQLQTSTTQVASEVSAGNDLVIVAGNDVHLRASQVAAGNDVELHAGLVTQHGDILLDAGQNTANSQSQAYSKKTGLSLSGGGLSLASASDKGAQGLSSESVGSQIIAGRNATLQASRDIDVVGSGIGAGRDVVLDAGRDVNVLAAAQSRGESGWSQKSNTGISFSSDDNGFSVFAGKERLKGTSQNREQTADPSRISAGSDLSISAGRDIRQVGSDLLAGHDIGLKAGRDISIDTARESTFAERTRSASSSGLGGTLNHNFGNTRDTVGNTGQGQNNTSKVSSAMQSADSISQFLAGPTADVRLGNSRQSSSQQFSEQGNRASSLSAGNDINIEAGNAVNVKGSQLGAGRDINIKGRDVTLDVAKGSAASDSQQSQGWGGIHGGTSGGLKLGIGGSYGNASGESSQGNSLPTQLAAGRDLNLQASHDLSLIGTQAQSGRDINLQAGNDLSIRAAQNDSSSESQRHSGGAEVGVTAGSQGVGPYVSVNLGKGQLEREAQQQQNAHLQAGNSLNFSSGQDTTIAGAELRGNDVVGRVGGDLSVSSVADTGKAKGKEFDLSATVTAGPGPGLSGSLGLGKTTGSTHWVQEQTGITAADRIDIRTEGHTQLDGALIASDSGNLKLDTGTLGFSDLAGHDKEHSYYLNVGGTYGLGGGSPAQDSSQVGKGKEGEAGWSVSGYDNDKDRQQIVRGTVGAGEIIVRQDADTGRDSTAGLNRDVSQAYEITKDHEERTDLYVSGSSLDAVGSPVATTREWTNGLLHYDKQAKENFDQASIAINSSLYALEKLTGQPIPKGAVAAGGQEIADQALQALLASGRTLGEAKAQLSDPAFQAEVLSNLHTIETLYKTSPELLAKAEQGLAAKNIDVKLPSITNDKLALDRVSDINQYLQEHPEQAEAVGIVLAAAQGPKGLLMWAAQKALGETSIGQAVAQVQADLQARLGQEIAEGIEGKPISPGDEYGAWRIGGGTLMAGLLLGSAEGAIAGKVINGTKATVGSVELKFDKASRTWTSPAGLDYGQGSVHGNRVKHVLDHAVPNPNKTTHSVFNLDRKEILGLVDQAWLKKGSPVSGDPGAYIVPMGRVVGTSGESSVKIIVRPGTNKIITAYPVD